MHVLYNANDNQKSIEIDGKVITSIDIAHSLILDALHIGKIVTMLYTNGDLSIDLLITPDITNSCSNCVFRIEDNGHVSGEIYSLPEVIDKGLSLSCPLMECSNINFILPSYANSTKHYRNFITKKEAERILCSHDICPYIENCDEASLCLLNELFKIK